MLAVAGLALCFVPATQRLGYEWSLAMAPLAAIAGAHLGAARPTAFRRARAGTTVPRLFAHVLVPLLLSLLVPLAIILANGLRVGSCNALGGLAWFVALPLASAIMGAAWGVVVGLARPWRRAWVACTWSFSGIALSLAACAAALLTTPSFFVHDPFLGYLVTTVYDEDLTLPRALLWSRAYQGALACAGLAACAALLDEETLALRLSAARGRARALVVAGLAFAIAGALWANRAALRFALGTEDVRRALGAERATPHMVLHYTPDGPYARDIDAFALDFEFRFAEHAKVFPRAPDGPVHVYLFDSPQQKQTLVGASNTQITKGWLRETYLTFDGWPQPSFAHELAHVFATPFGDPLVGTSHAGLTWNPGLMEGTAVASSWLEYEPWQPLTAHQVVKVLRDARLVDDGALAQVMGPGYYAIGPGRAYAIAGSFCRFLLETRGIDALLAIHRAGGAPEAWPRIYGASFDDLRVAWQRMVDAQTVTPEERAYALGWLERPPVFDRPCAHAAAVARQRAWAAMRAGDREGAVAAWRAACASEGAEPGDLDDAIDATFVAGDVAEARRLANALAARADAPGALRAAAAQALGDAALLEGDARAALVEYDHAAELPNASWAARRLAMKRALAARPPSEARAVLARAMVIAERETVRAFDLGALRKVVADDPGDDLAAYELARQLLARERYDEVLALATAPRAPLGEAALDLDRDRVVATAAFRAGDFARARGLFDAIAADPRADDGARRYAEDFRDRCDFARGYAVR